MNYVKIMREFTLKNIPDLDICVLAALELFSSVKIPTIPIKKFKRPLVIGSGNAAATGKIIFGDKDAVFANENNYEQKLKTIKEVDGVVIISASGGKHAPLMVKAAKKRKKPVLLITNNPHSPAGELLSSKEKLIYLKNREPYTYNTSTYMPMILGKTKEDPKKIMKFVNKISKMKLPNFKKYNAFYLILPPKFEVMRDMLDKKFVEMFGRQIPYTIFSTEYIKHATTIVQRPDELYISFGYNNKIWGKNRLNVPLPSWGDYATTMAVSYFIMGKIQRSRPAWFKKNIASYCKKISKVFGSTIKPIVE
jgi:hypothetical protein